MTEDDADPLRRVGPLLERAGAAAARTAEWGASTIRLAAFAWAALFALLGTVVGRWWAGVLVGVVFAGGGWLLGRGLRSWAIEVRADTGGQAVGLRSRLEAASGSVVDELGDAGELINRRLQGRGRLRSMWGLRRLARELPEELDDVLGAFTPTRVAGLVPRLSLAAWSALSLGLLVVFGPLLLAIALAVA
ncbi:MAG: hypothetical protein AAGA17_09080 [Actinomycetota bacterium]